MTGVGNLGEKFAIKIINDFLSIKSSMCDTATQSLSRYCTYPVPVVDGKLACKGWYACVILDMMRPVNN